MLSLGSNGPTLEQNRVWHGVDGSQIVYPSVSTCITVTCVAGSKLIGCHLFYRNQPDKMNDDLKTFGDLAKAQGSVSSMYVVGMLDSWKASKANWTRYYSDDGTLYRKLREVTGYLLGIAEYDTSGQGEVDITALRAGPNVQFSYKKDDSAAVLVALTAFTARF